MPSVGGAMAEGVIDGGRRDGGDLQHARGNRSKAGAGRGLMDGCAREVCRTICMQ